MTDSEREELLTADGHRIVARFFAPPHGEAKAAVLIVPAMGTPQGFYGAFAKWLSFEGYLVATFDYRGSGESLRGTLREFDATISDWAYFDAGAALAAITARAGGLPLYWIGHSLGGQIVPFVPGYERAARIVTVAAGSGWWRENAPELRRKVWLLWYLLVPVLNPLAGYFPGRRLKMVGDLPRGVMDQWRRWCLNPEYAAGVEPGAREAYAAVTTPITSLSFTDDELMSRRNIDSLHSFYTGAEREMIRIAPEDVGLRGIGHFGFFKPRSEEALWRGYLLPALRG